MEQAGEYEIAAPRQTVWDALNNPDVLKRSLDGCQSMEQIDDATYAASVKAKVGPVSALFKADLEITDRHEPESYTINASAKGGAAGFGKGTARVQLADAGSGTLLTYTVSANVGGKLAQIGSRLIDGAARKMADDFFARFRTEVEREDGAAGSGEDAAAGSREDGAAGSCEDAAAGAVDGTPTEDRFQNSNQWLVWAIVFGVLVLTIVLTL